MSQNLHNELEETLESSRSQLESVSSELEKQKQLNEKLENDLMSIDREKSESPTVDSEHNPLAGLDVGRRVGTCYLAKRIILIYLVRKRLSDQRLSLLPLPQTPPFYLLSQARGIVSVNAMQNLKKSVFLIFIARNPSNPPNPSRNFANNSRSSQNCVVKSSLSRQIT